MQRGPGADGLAFPSPAAAMFNHNDDSLPVGSGSTSPRDDGMKENNKPAPEASSGKQKEPLLESAVKFAKQSAKLSLDKPTADSDAALEARFITPQDAVLVTADGSRLPGVPLEEAHKLNALKARIEDGKDEHQGSRSLDESGVTHTKAVAAAVADTPKATTAEDSGLLGTDIPGAGDVDTNGKTIQKSAEGPLRRSMPPSHTNPLFPPLPLYGPPSLLRNLQCATFRVSSFFLSMGFLGVIVLGAVFTSLPPFLGRGIRRIAGHNPDAEDRPFYEEETRRARLRRDMDRSWKRRHSQDRTPQDREGHAASNTGADGFVPTEGGPDPVVCDIGYYARRVGLDVEEFRVQTEDGFIIDLWHVFDPREHERLRPEDRRERGPDVFTGTKRESRGSDKNRRFPVLLMHGLLQSAGAYCCNDDDSLAFYLCKAGYDVWLGNNRCGFEPKHTQLKYADPRMWCWNIRQMGVFDLTALTSRVLFETGFSKLGLVCHSQGTTQTFVALAKEQRPELGEKLTVFCALAPAAYAGPLIGKMYFKFMRVITPSMFRLMFGIHAFIPIMMTMHCLVPSRMYGWLGYKVFWFLFDWSDSRWDRGLRDRFFQFAPVYVSAESMRWWLGRECFAHHKCILATKEEWRAEDREDAEADGEAIHLEHQPSDPEKASSPQQAPEQAQGGGPEKRTIAAVGGTSTSKPQQPGRHQSQRRKPRGARAWYNAQVPPFALWVCGKDDLVDGRKLLRRFERPGREPHVRLVHTKVLPEFEHLDVLWAMDAPQQVFCEVRDVLWKTCDVRDRCRVPRGCEDVQPWTSPPPPARPEATGSGADDRADQSEWSGSSSEDLSN